SRRPAGARMVRERGRARRRDPSAAAATGRATARAARGPWRTRRARTPAPSGPAIAGRRRAWAALRTRGRTVLSARSRWRPPGRSGRSPRRSRRAPFASDRSRSRARGLSPFSRLLPKIGACPRFRYSGAMYSLAADLVLVVHLAFVL